MSKNESRTTNKSDQFSLGSFASGLVLGLLVASAWFLGGNGQPMTFTPTPSSGAALAGSTATSTSTTGSTAISVSDQSAGNTVTVESVTVPPPGVWVAVRDVNGSTLGNVLGAELVGGPRSNVEVSLLRATVPGRQYAIELYRDDGNGTFDVNSDSVYVDFNTGEPVIAYFNTTN